MEEIKHKQEILDAHRKRLHQREVQAALFGPGADPIIKIEIEDIREQIRELEHEIELLSMPNARQIAIVEDEQLSSLIAEFSSIRDDPKVDYKHKAECGEKILSIEPNNRIVLDLAHVYFEMALAYRQAALLERHLRDALENQKSIDLRSASNRGSASLKSYLDSEYGNWDEWKQSLDRESEYLITSISALYRASVLHPQFHQACYWRGRMHLQLDQVDLAIEDFTSAIKTHPNDGKYYLWRARAFMKRHMDRLNKSSFLKKLFFNREDWLRAAQDAEQAKRLGERLSSQKYADEDLSKVMLAGIDLLDWDHYSE